MASKKLYRSRKNRYIAGVCGGIGEYLDIDPTVVRLLWVFSVLAMGIGVLAYIVCVFIIPEEPGGKGSKKPPEPVEFEFSESQARTVAGLVMVFIGTVLTLNNLGFSFLFSWFSWSFVGPFVLVAIGVALLLRPGNFTSKKG